MTSSGTGWKRIPMGGGDVVPLGVLADTQDYGAKAIDYGYKQDGTGNTSRQGPTPVRDAVLPATEGKSLAERKAAKAKREEAAPRNQCSPALRTH